MRYMLLIYGEERAWDDATPEGQETEMKAWYAYTEWLREKGWYLHGEALEPIASASTVRAPEGAAMTTDGPFAETKEQLGGYYAVQCANLDEAIEAAGRMPSLARGGAVEIRPIVDFPDEAPA
ncbi:MAG: YciI family protein [Actinomycetota bacterium]